MLLWFKAGNLEPYCALFQQHQVNGKKLDRMTRAGLEEMGVSDPFHMDNIMECIDELCRKKSTRQSSVVCVCVCMGVRMCAWVCMGVRMWVGMRVGIGGCEDVWVVLWVRLFMHACFIPPLPPLTEEADRGADRRSDDSRPVNHVHCLHGFHH